MNAHDASTGSNPALRLDWLDMSRGLALIAMTTFHFAWDLEFFGYAPAGMTSLPAFKWYARGIAFSFLLIAGFSFALAYGHGINGRKLLKRTVQIGGAALLISAGTWFATPDRFVFFGILHQIAVASLIMAVFVRANVAIIFVAAILIAALPHMFRHEIFDVPWLWWTGLGTIQPATNDYVPVFPWTAYAMFGLLLGKLAISRNWLSRPKAQPAASGPAGRGLVFLGKHSLIYYLVHQPVLFALLTAFAYVLPPDRTGAFVSSCQTSCEIGNEAKFCQSFCGCVKDELVAAGIINDVISGKRDGASDPQVLDTAMLCTNRAGTE